jgi:hypothetical protein
LSSPNASLITTAAAQSRFEARTPLTSAIQRDRVEQQQARLRLSESLSNSGSSSSKRFQPSQTEGYVQQKPMTSYRPRHGSLPAGLGHTYTDVLMAAMSLPTAANRSGVHSTAQLPQQQQQQQQQQYQQFSHSNSSNNSSSYNSNNNSSSINSSNIAAATGRSGTLFDELRLRDGSFSETRSCTSEPVGELITDYRGHGSCSEDWSSLGYGFGSSSNSGNTANANSGSSSLRKSVAVGLTVDSGARHFDGQHHTAADGSSNSNCSTEEMSAPMSPI